MGINKFELNLASYLEYKGHITFSHFKNKYGKSISSLKRNIYNLNSYLPIDKHYIIDIDRVNNQMKYEELLLFIESLNMYSYTPSKEERMYMLSVYCFFEEYVNVSRLYTQIGMSQTAKKADSKDIEGFLKEYELSKKSVASRGMAIVGHEEKYRMLITGIMCKYMEVDLNDDLIERKANNPLEKLICSYFLENTEPFFSKSKEIINRFLTYKDCKVSYPSKKFLIIYIVCVLYRNSKEFYIKKKVKFKVRVEETSLFESDLENHFISNLIGSFDFTKHMNETAYDRKLFEVTRDFLKIVFEKMTTKIYTYNDIFEEVYTYLKKAILTISLREDFYDTKLDETHIHIKKMYGILADSVYYLEDEFDLDITKAQIAGLSLIFRKYVINNRIYGRNTKKIVIVSNSSIEKSKFFYIFLKQYIDVKLSAIININELYLLKEVEYDYIFMFSNRIKNLVSEMDDTCIKLDFYISHEEMRWLVEKGFSTAIRKMNLEKLAKELTQKTEKEIIDHLKEEYPEYFII